MPVSENDSLSIAGLCLALQRIGLSHWSADAVLRSWATAPLFLSGNRVTAPCLADEAIWIGFWLEGDAEFATISVIDKISGLRADKRCPESFQLASLTNGSPQPIHRDIHQTVSSFMVDVSVTDKVGKTTQERLDLCLLEPQAWAKESGRPAPEPLKGPPPLPPRLG